MIRRRRITADEPNAISDTAVFITPMLDMSFQLLFFFVIMFQPQGEERRMPLGLGTADAGGEEVANPNPKAGTNVTKTPTNYSLELHANKAGRLRRVVVNAAGNKDDFLIRPPATPERPFTVEILLYPDTESMLLQPEGVKTEDDAIRYLVNQLNMRMRYHKKENDKEDRIEVKGMRELKWKDSVAVMSAVMHYLDDKNQSVPLYPNVETNLLTPRGP